MDENIISLSDFKARASALLDDLNTPIVVTQNGKASAVVQSYDDYQSLQSSLALLKLMALREKEVKEGKTFAQDEVFEEARRVIEEIAGG